MRKEMLFINNIRVKDKLFMIYLLCIFLPIVIINTIFLNMISKNIRSHEMQNMAHMLTKMEAMLTTNIDDAIRLSHKFHISRGLYEALETEYDRALYFVMDYFDYYRRAILDYIPYYSQIQQVNIYTDNMTVLNSNGVRKLSTIDPFTWYAEFVQSSKSILLYPHVADNVPHMGNQRFVSVIRKMDRFAHYNKFQKLAKIDLSFSVFSELSDIMNHNGTLFIIDNQDRIIYSNHPSYFSLEMDYFPIYNGQEFSSSHAVLSHSIQGNVLLRDWKIVLMHQENEIYEMLGRTRSFILLITGISLLAATAVILLISRSFQVRLSLLTTQMKRLRNQDFGVIQYDKIGNDEIGVVIKTYNQMTTRIWELIQAVFDSQLREKNIELARKQAELNALQAQVNPHYLMNVLEAVRMKLVIKGDMETATMLKHIFRSIRKTITWDHDWNTIQDEIDIIKSFLEIQQYRYGDEIEYILEFDDGILSLKIPKMSFQPFVENAYLHGVNGLDKKGVVFVRIARAEDYIHFQIKDNGRGMTAEKLKEIKRLIREKDLHNSSIGIANVLRRLCLYYDNDFVFDIKSEINAYTQIDLRLPLRKGIDVHESPEV